MNEADDLESLTPEEKLQAENELLKLKLQAEFGMTEMGSSLGKEADNIWLNNIYHFEKQFAENKRCKVYDFIGRPEFIKVEKLGKDSISTELERINTLMNEKGIELSTICDYDDEIIYRFITEELFEHETDEIHIPGMMSCFIYEEFYPNHEYDICQHASEFIRFLIKQNWDPFMNSILLNKTITFNESIYDKETFQEVIHAFQANHKKLKVQKWEINTVKFDLETELASLEGYINYKSITNSQSFEGKVYLELKLEYDYWSISKIDIPGFSN